MAYSLVSSYAGQALIDGFNFVSIADPTNGFVSYKSYDDAVAAGLVSLNDDVVTLSVDSTNTYASDGSQGGRPSVRIESKVAVEQGLVIGDFAHMPGSICGSWPAFWMYGPDWPNGGEIDIIEGANVAYDNLMSAHTSDNCVLPSTGSFTGTQVVQDCTDSRGCNYIPPSSDTTSYGDTFNAAGGGVYALEWTSDTIKIWHFSRDNIPADITNQVPDPSGWGEPEALFGTSSCDVSTHFSDMSIVLNMDFCGDYAGAIWSQDATCSAVASTCNDFVANNPSALTDVYWEINSINVYSALASTTTTTEAVASPTVTASVQTIDASIIVSPSNGTTVVTTVSNGVNTQTTSAAPLSTTTSSSGNPSTVGGFAYLGCFDSTTLFGTFTLTGTSSFMTVSECTSLCSGSKYAGIVDIFCYCSATLDAGTTALADDSSCNDPCPGYPAQFCGGHTSSVLRRAAGPTDLLTVYVNLRGANVTVPTPIPAPALGANATTSTAVRTITSTVTYTTICATNPAELVAVTTCVEYTVCATETAAAKLAVPVTTLTQSCNACGQAGSSVVTLTVPVACVATQLANATSISNNGTVPRPPVGPLVAGATAAANAAANAAAYASANAAASAGASAGANAAANAGANAAASAGANAAANAGANAAASAGASAAASAAASAGANAASKPNVVTASAPSVMVSNGIFAILAMVVMLLV